MRKQLLIRVPIILTILTAFSILARAESTFAAPLTERLRIDLFTTPEWIEVDHVEEIPETIALKLVNKKGVEHQVARFSQDGPALPALVSVFKGKVKSQETLFAVVKWHYYLSGVNTEGDYYEVHVYQALENKNGSVQLLENKRISDFFGSGFDGKQEGKRAHFRFKDAPTIRHALSLTSQEN